MSDPLFLTRLQLQQFRSFANLDVELDAAPGVLIVQGTNGLGKSSLFHGLEWVLTDQIEEFRLVDQQRAAASYLCRWSKPAQTATAVAMGFSDGQILRRELATPKTKTSKFSGPPNIAAYLKTDGWSAEIEDLRHYLLLTHFLSQSNLPRIPHRSDKDRFDILKDAAQSREPERIGKALHGANTTRPARAFKTLIDTLDDQAKMLDQLLDQESTAWSDAQVSGALEPAAAAALGRDIAALLQQASENGEPIGAATDVSPSALASALDAIKLGSEREALALTRAREVIAERSRLQIDVAETQEAEKAVQPRLSVLPEEENRARAALNQARDRLKVATDAATEAQTRLARLGELASTEADLAAVRLTEAARPSAKNLQARVEQAEAQIATINHRQQILDRLRADLAAISDDHERLMARQATVDELAAAGTRVDVQAETQQRLEHQHPSLLADLQAAQSAVQAHRAEIAAIETTFSTLSQAADAIAAAVSTIVVNLAGDACDCPVCATPFPTAEALRIRADAAADRLAPELTRQQVLLQEARKTYATALERHDALSAVAAEIAGVRTAIEAERSSLVDSQRRAADLGLVDIADLSALRPTLGHELNLVARRQTRRRRWLANLDQPGVAATQMQAAVRVRDTAVRDRNMDERSRADAVIRQNWLLSEVERLRLDLFGSIDPDKTKRDETALSIHEQASSRLRERDALQIEVARAGQAVALLSEEAATITARRTAVAERMTELRRQWVAQGEEWKALGMTEGPSPSATAEASVKERETRLARRRDILADAASRLQALRVGTVAWSRQGAHRTALDRIRRHVKGAATHTREQVRETAIAKRDEVKARKADATRTKAVAAQASVKIDEALNEFNADYIRPLAKLMNRINRSILCDPRIGIDFTVDKNAVGQRAVVGEQIPSDRGDVDPRLVHSEGQMAALGVSLLAAASLTFGWSRWKALVLDDPLQHNDAIHAAAFADFVGNLVDARGYQVLLSTHELAQAEFLRRKFRARGIPCTMVTLLGAGSEGVEETIDGPAAVRAASG